MAAGETGGIVPIAILLDLHINDSSGRRLDNKLQIA